MLEHSTDRGRTKSTLRISLGSTHPTHLQGVTLRLWVALASLESASQQWLMTFASKWNSWPTFGL